MKKIVWLLALIFLLTGCGTNPTPASSSGNPPAKKPPIIARMSIASQKYSYESAAGLSSNNLKMSQVPSRVEALDGSNQPVRIASIKAFDGANKVLTYDIQYPANGLVSVAKFRYNTYRAILEETFPEKWQVKYEYNQQYPEKYGIPAAYTIYAYTPGTGAYDQVVEKSTLAEKGSGVLHFKTDQGVSVDWDTNYFIVLPDER